MNVRHLISSILVGIFIGTSAFLALVRWMQLHILYVSVMRRCTNGALVNAMWPEDCAQWTSPWRGELLVVAILLAVLAVVILFMEARQGTGR